MELEFQENSRFLNIFKTMVDWYKFWLTVVLGYFGLWSTHATISIGWPLVFFLNYQA